MVWPLRQTHSPAKSGGEGRRGGEEGRRGGEVLWRALPRRSMSLSRLAAGVPYRLSPEAAKAMSMRCPTPTDSPAAPGLPLALPLAVGSAPEGRRPREGYPDEVRYAA